MLVGQIVVGASTATWQPESTARKARIATRSCQTDRRPAGGPRLRLREIGVDRGDRLPGPAFLVGKAAANWRSRSVSPERIGAFANWRSA
jgi:hypothetical protein